LDFHDRLKVAFAVTITVQFLIIALHDLVDVRDWVRGSQVRAVIGRRKAIVATAINALFPGLAMVLAVMALFGPVPRFAASYPVIYCAITVVSAIAMWWVPYWFGTDEKTRREYGAMYAGTKQVLPARGDNPRPNVAHLWFHALFALNLGMAAALTFGA
jgi:hypothetical protein